MSSSSKSIVESPKELAAKSDDVKIDKSKLALAVLAWKKAAESKSGTQERQEDDAVFKGNYPLLVCNFLFNSFLCTSFLIYEVLC